MGGALLVLAGFLVYEVVRGGYRNHDEAAERALGMDWTAFAWISVGLIANGLVIEGLGFIIASLLLFLTFLSANLAILNFLPIPALDGGHMMFLTAEAIRGKPVNEELQVRMTLVGVMCLLALMAFVIIKGAIGFIS